MTDRGGPADENISPLGAQIFLMGEIYYLLSHSKRHLGYTVVDIINFLMVPIKLNQYRIYRTDAKPVGFVCWAYLQRRQALDHFSGKRELRPSEWRSGDELWFVEFIAPFGDTARITKELRSGLFAKSRGFALKRGDELPERIVEWHGYKYREAGPDRERQSAVSE